MIDRQTSLRDRVAFFSQMNSFRSKPSNEADFIRKNSINEPSEPASAPDPEELGAFRRSGSVRDLARRFGSNNSLNSNSNNSNFARNVTNRRSWHFSTSTKPIEIGKSEKPELNLKPTATEPKPVIAPPRRKANFLDLPKENEPEKSPATPKIRKSQKLAELEQAEKNNQLMTDKPKIRIRRKSSFGKDQQVKFKIVKKEKFNTVPTTRY